MCCMWSAQLSVTSRAQSCSPARCHVVTRQDRELFELRLLRSRTQTDRQTDGRRERQTEWWDVDVWCGRRWRDTGTIVGPTQQHLHLTSSAAANIISLYPTRADVVSSIQHSVAYAARDQASREHKVLHKDAWSSTILHIGAWQMYCSYSAVSVQTTCIMYCIPSFWCLSCLWNCVLLKFS